MYDLVQKGVQFSAERREEVLKTEDEKEEDKKKAKHYDRIVDRGRTDGGARID